MSPQPSPLPLESAAATVAATKSSLSTDQLLQLCSIFLFGQLPVGAPHAAIAFPAASFAAAAAAAAASPPQPPLITTTTTPPTVDYSPLLARSVDAIDVDDEPTTSTTAEVERATSVCSRKAARGKRGQYR